MVDIASHLLTVSETTTEDERVVSASFIFLKCHSSMYHTNTSTLFLRTRSSNFLRQSPTFAASFYHKNPFQQKISNYTPCGGLRSFLSLSHVLIS